LFLFFCWAFSPGLYSLPSDTAGNGTSLPGELTRLIEISTRLGELNETLRSELENSRKNSAELSNMLMNSKAELDGLRGELESLRRTSTELLNKAELSNQESKRLREALTKAESSLTSLEQSFGDYKMAAEARISSLEGSGRFYKYGFFAGIILALSGWAAFALTR
jgi:chromosome segregation ATPase